MEAHFGLGNATNVETLRIEWPSGHSAGISERGGQAVSDGAEPSRLVLGTVDQRQQFTLEGGRNMRYDIQTSSNLTDWSLLDTVTITNFDGTLLVTDTNAPGSDRRFYRAVMH